MKVDRKMKMEVEIYGDSDPYAHVHFFCFVLVCIAWYSGDQHLQIRESVDRSRRADRSRRFSKIKVEVED